MVWRGVGKAAEGGAWGDNCTDCFSIESGEIGSWRCSYQDESEYGLFASRETPWCRVLWDSMQYSTVERGGNLKFSPDSEVDVNFLSVLDAGGAGSK